MTIKIKPQILRLSVAFISPSMISALSYFFKVFHNEVIFTIGV